MELDVREGRNGRALREREKRRRESEKGGGVDGGGGGGGDGQETDRLTATNGYRSVGTTRCHVALSLDTRTQHQHEDYTLTLRFALLHAERVTQGGANMRRPHASGSWVPCDHRGGGGAGGGGGVTCQRALSDTRFVSQKYTML